MAGTKPLLLFGDASGEKLSGIRDLCDASKTSPAARRFLKEATDVVQHRFCGLSSHDHGWDRTINSLLDMAEQHDNDGGNNIIVSAVLSCIGRLGKLIVFANEDPTILGTPSNPAEVVGLCAGGLPAVVAMAAKDTSHLFSLGRELISVSFDLALEGRTRMRLIEESSNQSWGKTYTGLSQTTVRGILDEFHKDLNIPKLKQVAIAVIAEDWLTLIAPPSTLKSLEVWSPEIRDAPQLATEVPGPIHSDTLPQIDISKVLSKADPAILNHPIDPSKARMLSPSTGQTYKHTTLKPLLEEVIQDIVHNPLKVNETLEACMAHIKQEDNQAVLYVMGSTNYLTPIRVKMKAQEIKYTIKQPENSSSSNSANEPFRVHEDDKIAIVGMAGRFPGSETVDGFWEDMLAGKCHIKEIPRSRFDLDEWYDASGVEINSTAARHGAFLENPGLFDHRLFNISPREAAQTDPGHRLLLMVSYEALQSAGYSPDNPSSSNPAGGPCKRVATYFGQVADEWQQIMNEKGADIYYVTGGNRAFGPGRLNYHYKWSGASIALDSACSTSATAISLACSALVAKECDMAMAGGVSIAYSPITFSGLARAGMLSTTGGCRTFHDDADGYARGEGAGAIVLKRLQDAVNDNDNILGVVRGWARTYSSEATSITTPSATSQELIYNQVLQQSGLDAADISYVEMHGTGTQTGDAEEMSSVMSALGLRRRSGNLLTVGAVKANLGHGEGAAGVTSLMKAILMLRERTIIPQPGWPFKINTKFPPLAESNIAIATKPSHLQPSRKGHKINILVNSFDASGGNVCIALEEPPSCADRGTDAREWHIVAVSAKTEASLQKNRERLFDFLTRYPDTPLADLGYTTTARRIHETLRCSYVSRSTRDILRQLSNDVKAARRPGAAPAKRPRPDGPNYVFLCTGQGSQYTGMANELFRTSESFRQSVSKYQQIATASGLPYFLDIFSDPSFDVDVASPQKVQLAILALEMATAHEMEGQGIVPSVVIGHSLGEFAALAIAGVLSPVDALLIVGKRAEIIQNSLTPSTHAMLVVSLPVLDLHQRLRTVELDRSCEIACENAPCITVASGSTQNIQRLKNSLDKEKVKSNILVVPYGFHSSQMDPIIRQLEKSIRGTVFHKPRIPIISSVTGSVHTDASEFSTSYVARQTRQRVQFVQALKSGSNIGLLNESQLYLELGPRPTLLGLVKQTLNIPTDQLLPTLKQNEDNWLTASNVLRKAYEMGGAINWHRFHAPFQRDLRLLQLPTYAFDSKDYWMPYPARKQSSSPSPNCRYTSTVTVAESQTSIQTAHLLQSSVHRIESENISERVATATFSSNIFHGHLWDAIKGHRVDGRIVCPMAVFNDFACSAAKYLYCKAYTAERSPLMSIRHVIMTDALVITEPMVRDSKLTVEVTAKLQLDSNICAVEFKSKRSSEDKSGTTSHGQCQVECHVERSSIDFSTSQHQNLFFVRSRISALKEQAAAGRAHFLLKPVVYSLFSSVVAYSMEYQAIQSVIMDNSCVDAVATITLPEQSLSKPSSFHENPFWNDAVLHIAGFLLNNNLRYPSDFVCMANGFESWQSSGYELRAGDTYTTYAVMQEDRSHSTSISGTCFVFKQDTLIQVASGVKFTKVKRAALNMILGVPGDGSLNHQSPTNSTSNLSNAIYSSLDMGIDEMLQAKQIQKSEPGTTAPGYTGSANVDVAATTLSVLNILAAETGVSVSELTDETRYTDLGVDSVMAITILSTITKEVGVELPASFFMENGTIGESKDELDSILRSRSRSRHSEQSKAMIQSGLVQSSPSQFVATPEASPSTTGLLTPSSGYVVIAQDAPTSVSTANDTSSHQTSPRSDGVSNQHACSTPVLTTQVVHYQGPRSGSTHKIFFIADETGSTFRYITLPSLGTGLNLGVYGVESPLLTKSDKVERSVTVRDLAQAYRAAIKKEQPDGVYMLGGISLGAVLAYEVVRCLLEHGDEVSCLFILDCPSPSLSDSGTSAAKVSGGNRLPLKPAQKRHIEDLVTVLQNYEPQPLSGLNASQDPARFWVHIVSDGQLESKKQQSAAYPAWGSLLPDLNVVDSGVETGAFLQMPKSKSIAKILQDYIGRVL